VLQAALFSNAAVLRDGQLSATPRLALAFAAIELQKENDHREREWNEREQRRIEQA
jgi:hypothetical protein